MRAKTDRAEGGRPTWVRVAVAGAAVLAIAAVGGFLWLRYDRAQPVPIDDVVDRYQADAAGEAARGRGTTAPPGVYVYATEGSEGVDALGGADHAYPDETAMTVEVDDDGCVTVRWDVLRQRYDEHVTCPSDEGWMRRGTTIFHSFFRQAETRTYGCEDDALDLPADPQPGATFTARCSSEGSGHSGESREDITATVVDFEDVLVEGEPRAAVHVRYETTVSGETSGSATLDRWLALDRMPLVLREVKDGATRSGTAIGTVEYHESYELRLTQWEPRR